MYCRHCGKKIDDSVNFCPYCGTPNPFSKQMTGPAEDTARTQKPAAPVQKAPAQKAPRRQQENAFSGRRCPHCGHQIPPGADICNYCGYDLGHKKGRKKTFSRKRKLPYAAIAVVLAVVMVVVLFHSQLIGLMSSAFGTPTSLYESAVKRDTGALENAINSGYTHVYNMSSGDGEQLSADIALNDSANVLIGAATEADVSWLDSIKVTSGAKSSDGHLLGNATVEINGQPLTLTGDMDFANKMIYVQVPKIMNKYLSISLADLEDSYSGYGEMPAQYLTGLRKAMPAPADLKKFVSRYVNIYLKYCKNVKKDKTTLEANGVSQTCTSLTVTLNGEQLRDMFMDALGSLKSDSLILNFLDSMQIDKTEYVSGIEEAIEELKNDQSFQDASFTGITYVSGSTTCGQSFTLHADGDDVAHVELAMPQNGKDVGLAISIVGDGDEYANVQGSGTKNGDLVTMDVNGNVPDSYGDPVSFKIGVEDFDLKRAQEKGEFKGAFTIAPDLSEIDSSLGTSVSLRMEGDVGSQNASLKVIPSYNSSELATISMTISGSPKDLKKADAGSAVAVSDQQALMSFLQNDLNFDAIKEYAQAINMPDTYEQELTQAIDQAKAGLSGSYGSLSLY